MAKKKGKSSFTTRGTSVKKGTKSPAKRAPTDDGLAFDRFTAPEVLGESINPGGAGFGPVTGPRVRRTNLTTQKEKGR